MRRYTIIVATVVLTAASSGFSQGYGGQHTALVWLPKDIKVTEYPVQERGQTQNEAILQIKEAGSNLAERAKLAGPSKLVPGEFVRFTYAWPVTATLKEDPSKVLNADYLRQTIFRFVGGDGHNTAQLAIPTGKVVTMTRPQSGTAPAGNLLSLAILSTVKGLSKDVIENRLCAPSKVETAQDGKERWYFHKEVVETMKTFHQTMTNTTGVIGQDGVSLSSVQTTPVSSSRKVVLWDFTLILDEKGNVERLEQGSIGAGEWKQAVTP